MNNKKLFAFTQEDGLFEWGRVVIAEFEEEANEIVYQRELEKAEHKYKEDIKRSARGYWINGYVPEKFIPIRAKYVWEKQELKNFIFEAGGNG